MSRGRSGSNRWGSNDQGFNRQNRSDQSRPYQDSDFGFSSQSHRYNPYDRQNQAPDYGFSSQNFRQGYNQSTQSNRGYGDSTKTQIRGHQFNKLGKGNNYNNPGHQTGYNQRSQKKSGNPKYGTGNYSSNKAGNQSSDKQTIKVEPIDTRGDPSVEMSSETKPDEPLSVVDSEKPFEEKDKINQNEIGSEDEYDNEGVNEDDDADEEEEDSICKDLPGSTKVPDWRDTILTNEVISEDNKIELIFLSHVFYNIFDNNSQNRRRIHCDLTSELYLSHRNALRLYRYEVRQLLDERYRQKNVSNVEVEEKKRSYLKESKETALLKMGPVFDDATEELKAKREKLVDECIDLISADVYPKMLVPEADDYVQDPLACKTNTELTQEFEWKFVVFTYNELGFTLWSKKGIAENLLKFHVGNEIIPALLVEIIRTFKFKSKKVKPGDRLQLTGTLKSIIKHVPSLNILRNPESRTTFQSQIKKGEVIKTEILDLLSPGTRLSPQVFLNFANSILYFDQVVTVVKSKLMSYTPFIPLSTEKKSQIFNDMVKSIYLQTLDAFEKDIPLSERKFENLV